MTLVVTGLGLSFRRHDGGRLTPLAGVDLTLARGDILGLVGGSGAGKSLVATVLMDMLPRNAERRGTVEMDGGPVRDGMIALAPQGIDALDPLAPVGRQLMRFGRLAGTDPGTAKTRALQLLAELDLAPEVMDLHPHMLSGGMAKRVLLATSLMGGAKILIADEPTLGLDPANADRIMACLAALAGPERGVLVISHDLPRLVAIARRVIVLREGQMVEEADARAFTGEGTALTHSFSRALWRAQLREDAL
jgi:peptide/nickel transport system ATP-binding protein